MCSAPIVAMVWQGENVISISRSMIGKTNPKDAAPGTIRADFADSIDANAVHGSDSSETATQEIAYFFQPQEICA